MISFDAMQSEVISRLGNRSDIQARSVRWINQAFLELILLPRFSFFELDLTTSFNTVAGTRVYNITDWVGLSPPATAGSTDSLWYILDISDFTNNRKLARTHWHVLDRIGYNPQISGQPTRYARFGNAVQLDPVPDGVFAMTVRYRNRPMDLQSGSTFVGLGSEWEEVIETMATIKGFEALDQRAKAGELRSLLEPMMSIRQDVPTQEDMDAEITIAPIPMGNYYAG